MQHIRILHFVMLMFLLPAFTYGQKQLTLDLEGARKHALEHNKSLINASYAIEKSELAVREAIANGLPQINAAVDYSNSLGASISIKFNPDMPATEIPINPSSNFTLTVGQLLFSANYIVGMQTARIYTDLTRNSRKRTELEVLTQVSEAYNLVLISEELLSILKMNATNLDNLYGKMTVMERAGVIEQTDVDQLSVQVNTMKNAVKSSERQLELATNMLRLYLGAPIDTEIVLTEKLPSILEDATLESSLLQIFNLNDNIDYQMMQQQVMINEKMVNMKKANALPTLSAFYRYTYKIIQPDFDMSPPNVLGVQMNIPIFSSGVRNAQVKQAAVDLKTAQNNQELLSDQLKLQEKQLRFNYASALETYQNQQKNVEVARRVYASLKLKYEQGVISGLDLVNADNNYLRAETDYISAMMQVLNTRVQLEKLYGTIR
jgi:outer membrane protein